MPFIATDSITLHYRLREGKGAPIVLLNSLGTDFRIWDEMCDSLSAEAPVLCIDKRGHGLSDMATITIPILANDVAHLMDAHKFTSAIVCGVSVGGLIAQQLAASRPDLVKALMLSNTGARIGTNDIWNSRIDAVEQNGIASISDDILQRWFSRRFLSEQAHQVAGYRNMLTRTSSEGYTGVSRAIRDTDLTNSTSALKIPTHCIAGDEDDATPVALVEALSQMIEGSQLTVLEQVGHLPCIEQPGLLAGHLDALYQTVNT